MVEEVLAHIGLNVGLHVLNYMSYLPYYIRRVELPRGCKVPKFSKSVGDTNESTVKHKAMFKTEASDMSNNDGLKMR